MKQKYQKFINKPFVRNVMILVTGTMGAQLFAILFVPIITRVYGPEAYGLMGTFLAITSILAPLVALNYPIAIVLPKSRLEAIGIAKLSFNITIIITLLVSAILILFHDYIIKTFNLESISAYLYLIPFSIFLNGIAQIMQQWLIRTKSFGVKSTTTFLEAFIENLSKVGIGLFYPVAFILILISALKNGIKIIIIIFLKKYRLKSIISNLKKAETNGLSDKYRDFPLLRSPEAFIFAATQSLPIIMLTSFFGPAAGGFYALGRTILLVPSTLIGRSIGDVFYPRISEAAYKQENLTRLIRKTTYILGLIGFLPYLFIIIFGPWAFSVVFGNDWHTAGEYARWMSIGSFFGFLKNPSIKSYPVISAQGFHLVFSVIILVVRTSSFVIGYFIFEDDVIAIALYGITGGILNLLQILISFNISTKFDLNNDRENL